MATKSNITLSPLVSDGEKTKSENSNNDNNDENAEDGEVEEFQNPEVSALAEQIHTNDLNGMIRLFASFKSKDDIRELVNERNEAGKSPLDVSAALGRVEITKLLIANGARIDHVTSKGYTCLHHAAAWGRTNALKILVNSGGNFMRKNMHGESPLDIAIRYNQADCVEFMEHILEKKKMQAEITRINDKLKEIEKISIAIITKEEKNNAANACVESQEWLDNFAATSTSEEIKAHYTLLVLAVQPLLNRLSVSCKLIVVILVVKNSNRRYYSCQKQVT